MSDVINEYKNNCVGCGLCNNVCPVGAITMVKDKLGFIYPKIDKNKCINCGICIKKCPTITNPIEKKTEEIVYAYCTNNEENWINSTSGGAFYDICCLWNSIYKNCKIYGAYQTESNEVFHCGVTIKELNKFQKSKYIQSNINNCYKEIKLELDNEGSIIFSGTPCQCAALRNFLNKNYEKLLIIDVVCHGVGSSKILNACIKYEEKNIGKKIVQYNFRKKRNENFRPKDRYNIEYVTNDGKKVISTKDIYMKFFLKGSCLRLSCLKNCKFKAINSYSDLSLSDLNNKSSIIPEVISEKNFSAIFVHSEKGKKIVNKLKKFGMIIECDNNKVIKYNKVYKENPQFLSSDFDFFDRIMEDKFIINDIKKYKKNMVKMKIKFTDFIPYKLKCIINNIRSRRKRNVKK